MNTIGFILLLSISLPYVFATPQEESENSAMVSRAAMKEKSTEDCLTECNSKDDCNCWVKDFYNSTISRVYTACAPLAGSGSTQKFCQYFVDRTKRCSFGPPKNPTLYGYLPCYDEVATDVIDYKGKPIPKRKDLNISCRKVDGTELYHCTSECGAVPTSSYCKDKDGYSSSQLVMDGKCPGTKPNTFLVCGLTNNGTASECGATGAPCHNLPCCPGHKCNSKTTTCIRDCAGYDDSCKDVVGYHCCDKYQDKKLSCTTGIGVKRRCR